jgi:hypothetical protein
MDSPDRRQVVMVRATVCRTNAAQAIAARATLDLHRPTGT